jgi:Zn-dependent protease with chaperone function
MEYDQFERTVERLTILAARAPRLYVTKVALFAAGGFALLLGVIAVLVLLPLALVGLLVLAFTSGHASGAAVLLAKLGKGLLLLAPAIWIPLRTAFEALFSRFEPPGGTPINQAQAPALFAAIDDLRQRMRGPRFHQVLISDDLNASVVQRPRLGPLGWQRNYLVLGLPLLESLSAREALAVVAHEYGHLAGAHGRFSAFIYRLRWSWSGIETMSSRWTGWGGRGLARLLGWFAPRFNAYTFVLARANEYQADAAAAALVGQDIAGTALMRVHVAAKRYGEFWQKQMARSELQAAPPESAYDGWATLAASAPEPAAATQYLQEALAETTGCADTHPALVDRLAALGLPGEAAANTLTPPPAHPHQSAALVWLGALAHDLRRRHQDTWRDGMGDSWRARHAEYVGSLERLHALQAQASTGVLSDDEHWERWNLLRELDDARVIVPDREAAALAYVDAHLNDNRAHYVLGLERLAQANERGLVDLEHCIKLQAESTLPACARALDYLKEDDPRTAEWRARYDARAKFETARDTEKQNLDAKHPLTAHDATPEQWREIEAFVRERRNGIARAYFARRILPSAPDIPTYVLALQLGGWSQYWDKDQEIVNRFDDFPFPAHVMICSLYGGYAPMRKVLKKLPGCRIKLKD